MVTKSIGRGFTVKDGKVRPIATGSVSDKIRAKKSKKVKPGRRPGS